MLFILGINPSSKLVGKFCRLYVFQLRLLIVIYTSYKDLSPWYIVSCVLSVASSTGIIVMPSNSCAWVSHHQLAVYSLL